MILAKNFLSKEVYQKAKTKGITTFLFNEIDFIPEENGINGEVFFNCNTERVDSTWYTWEENEKCINNFKKKFPQFFVHQGYDLTLAICKAMFWANFKTGFLWYSVKMYFPEEEIYYIEPMHQGSKSHSIFRYIKSKINSPKKPKSDLNNNDNHRYSYAVHIKNDFQAGLYQDIIRKIIQYKEFKIFIDSGVNRSNLDVYGYSDFQVLPSFTGNPYPTPSINILKIKGSDWFVFNAILKHWNELCGCVDSAKQMIHSGLKAALINEAENGIYGAVISEVFVKNNTKVYNTMNGIKSGEAQDAHINFDQWFVWDDQMKSLLIRKNNIFEDKLIVSGHLVEDLIRNYKYRDSLNIDRKSLKGKKVISLFSVKGKRYVKLEAIKFLNELLKNDDSIILLIRPHPSEKPEDYILHDSSVQNIHYVYYNSHNQNDTLHDQILISDLCIVFGSTVALDSKWMGVPCITFEVKENSLIYCIDNENIKHVRTIEEFATAVKERLELNKKQKCKKSGSVSELIIREIMKNE